MLRRSVRLFAAVLLAFGLVCAGAGSPGLAKSKKADKKASSKSSKSSKKDKKSSKHERSAKKDKKSGKKDNKKDKKSKKSDRSDDRVAKSSKSSKNNSSVRRGKNDDDDDDTASTRSRRTNAPDASVAKRVVDNADGADDGSGDDTDEPAGPKPANRVVADISPMRVSQIQTALIAKGLLAGPANGVYDQPTFLAMQTFQTRNGWNPVGVPTADSLKALGVPKNSGRAYMTPARVVDATAPTPPQR